jgi:hypothetical protein
LTELSGYANKFAANGDTSGNSPLEHVTLAFVDQGYTGPEPTAAAQAEGIEVQVVKLPTARQGFVLLPKRWVVEIVHPQMTKPNGGSWQVVGKT